MVESVNKYSKFLIDENGILHAAFHTGVVIDLEAACIVVQERIKFSNGKSYPILLDLTGLKHVTPKAHRYFSSAESVLYITGGAFLVNSFFSKFLGNVYLQGYPPPCPTKLFTSKEEALVWLNKFL